MCGSVGETGSRAVVHHSLRESKWQAIGQAGGVESKQLHAGHIAVVLQLLCNPKHGGPFHQQNAPCPFLAVTQAQVMVEDAEQQLDRQFVVSGIDLHKINFRIADSTPRQAMGNSI